MKKFFIFGGIVAVVVVAAVLLLVGNINTLVEKGVETFGPKVLQAPVTLDKADIDVTSGKGSLHGLTVGNPAGFKTDHAFQLDSISIDLDTASLTQDKIHIRSIIIKAPSVVQEGLIGKSNLEQLQANALAFGGGKQKSEEKSGGKKVQIDLLKIEKGSISISGALLQGKKMTVPLPPIELRDIGKNKDTSMAEAMGQVLVAVNKAALPAVQSGLSAVGEGAKQVGGAVQEGVEKGIEGIKGLFGN